MISFELESDRDVLVDSVGLLEAGKPVVVGKSGQLLFKAKHGITIARAKFPNFVKVTAFVSEEVN